jgi:hypothetical protein
MSGPPPRFAGESVAVKTRWDPLKGGGASFRTRTLTAVNPSRMEFRPSWGLRLFAGTFVLLGVGAAVMGMASRGWPMLGFGAAFAALGAGLYYFGAAPVVFDRARGAYWRGRTEPRDAAGRATLKHCVSLEDIHALQIVAERVRGDDRTYTSYELNLVLRDGRRFNVTDHGDYDALRDDAQTLAAFLGRPVWDATAGGSGSSA